MVRLSERMEAIGRLVTPGSVLCDVGCDHGFLPIALVKRGQIEEAVALDLREGPLAAAKKHIAEEKLQNKIITKMSDGLLALEADESQSIVIAGMGGGLVIHILSDAPQVARAAKELILQPQSEVERVRRFLWEQGYLFLAEDMVFEDGKFYPMMKAVYRPNSRRFYTKEELCFGPCLLSEKHPVLKEYLWRKKGVCENVLRRLGQCRRTEAVAGRIREKEADLRCILRAMVLLEET